MNIFNFKSIIAMKRFNNFCRFDSCPSMLHYRSTTPKDFDYIVVFFILHCGFRVIFPQNSTQFNTPTISMCNNFCWNGRIEKTIIFNRSSSSFLIKKDFSTTFRMSCRVEFKSDIGYIC